MRSRTLLVVLLAAISIVPVSAAHASTSASWTCRGVQIHPGDVLNQAVGSHPEGTTFCLARGRYRLAQTLHPKSGDRFIGQWGAHLNGAKLLTKFQHSGSYWIATNQGQQGRVRGLCRISAPGCRYPDDVYFDGRRLVHATALNRVGSNSYYFDYANNRIYLGRNPAGHKVEAAQSPMAIARGKAKNVVVQNLLISKFASPAGTGTIGAGPGWVVKHNHVRKNHGIGICARGGGSVLYNKVDHNGQLGLCGSGSGINFVGNISAYNNTAGYSPHWEAGGAKFVGAHSLLFNDNLVTDNGGHGIWTDQSSSGIVVKGNRVSHNSLSGIVLEISSNATVTDNTVTRNGGEPAAWQLAGSGVFVSNSKNVSVSGNTISRNRNGVIVLDIPRGTEHAVSNVSVGNNRIACSGNSGVSKQPSATAILPGTNFHDNAYQLPSNTSSLFHWRGRSLTWREWQGAGNDRGGSATYGC